MKSWFCPLDEWGRKEEYLNACVMRKIPIAFVVALLLLGFMFGCSGKKDGIGVQSMTGEVVIPFQYEEARDFAYGLAPVREARYLVVFGGRWGYIDRAGRFVISPKYDAARSFSYAGSGAVEYKGKWYLMSEEGLKWKSLGGDEIDYVGDFSGQYAPISVDLKCGLIDMRGEMVVKPVENCNFYVDGPIAVTEDGEKWGFIGTDGEFVISPRYSFARSFSDGLAPVQMGLWGFIDRDAQLVIKPKYIDAHPFYEGLAAVKTREGWGFINKSDRMVIKPSFAFVGHFSNGLAAATYGNLASGSWGFIDMNGEMVVKPIYDEVKPFHQGLAAVRIGKKWGYISR